MSNLEVKQLDIQRFWGMKKVILFELNEVPFRIIDYFIDGHPESTLAKAFPKCAKFETYAEDDGHLSPWTTWPTVHRGVTNSSHFIQDFGQDLAEVDDEFPPLWKILAKKGVSVGVCGSLHSYPMPDDLDGFKFYLPDTFAAGSECFPSSLDVFQQFNLSMARASPRNVTKRVEWTAALRMLRSMPDLGFRFQTAMQIGRQLLDERKYPWKTVRRRTYQTFLAFDVFMRQLQKTKPRFTTFFTNHVASSMHRYWAALFPDDYETFEYDDEWVNTYRTEIDFTMGVTDQLFARLKKFADRNEGYQIWITTSMGQEATMAKSIETQVYLTDPKKFFELTMGEGFSDWHTRPAMAPQSNFSISGRESELEKVLNTIRVAGTDLCFRRVDSFFSLDFGQDNVNAEDCFMTINGNAHSFADAGLENVEITDKSGCSAYHIPQGSLFIYDPANERQSDERKSVSTTQIAPAILESFDVSRPEYMAESFAGRNGSAASKILAK